MYTFMCVYVASVSYIYICISYIYQSYIYTYIYVVYDIGICEVYVSYDIYMHITYIYMAYHVYIYRTDRKWNRIDIYISYMYIS